MSILVLGLFSVNCFLAVRASKIQIHVLTFLWTWLIYTSNDYFIFKHTLYRYISYPVLIASLYLLYLDHMMQPVLHATGMLLYHPCIASIMSLVASSLVFIPRLARPLKNNV